MRNREQIILEEYVRNNNSNIPEWAVNYYVKFCKGNILSTEPMTNYTIECVRDIIYKYFKLVGKRKLTKERKAKIAWVCYCNFNSKKYGKFIDLNFRKFSELKIRD